MMENNKWKEEEIKRLLGELPPIEDKRSKDVVFARLKEEERLQKPTKRKRSLKWLPASVAIASILVFSLLLPSMLGEKDEHAKSTAELADLKTSEQSQQAFDTESETSLGDDADVSVASGKQEATVGYESNILLSDELGERSLFQIGLVSDTNVIPITFLIPEEQIHADFPGATPNVAQLYTKYAAAIPEEKLGFDNYHPYKGDIVMINDVIMHNPPDDDSYNQTPAMKELYTSTFQTTFSNYPERQIGEVAGESANFNVESELSSGVIPGAYYKYVMSSGQLFLIPQYGNKNYTTVEKALLGMQDQPNSSVASLIPEHVKYDVRVEKGIAKISFQEVLDLSEMQAAEAMSMIEGFILTAHHYHSTVQLENIVQESFDKYDFNAPLAEPIAVNPVEFMGER